MRAVIQRVKSSKVEINKKIYSSISEGLLIFIGIEETDNIDDIEWLANKIINLRIFNDSEGKMNLSVIDIYGELMVVSQFTLHAYIKKGNRPSFIRAASPNIAIPLYEKFIFELEKISGKNIKSGIFGANMSVSLINDGPVTILIDTKNKE